MSNILDRNFKYRPGADVIATWKRHGFKRTTAAERRAQQLRTVGDAEHAPVKPEEIPAEVAKATVTQLKRKAAK